MKTLRILWLLVLSLVLGLAVQAQQRFNNLTILSNLTVNGSATITNLTGSLTNVTVDGAAPALWPAITAGIFGGDSVVNGSTVTNLANRWVVQVSDALGLGRTNLAFPGAVITDLAYEVLPGYIRTNSLDLSVNYAPNTTPESAHWFLSVGINDGADFPTTSPQHDAYLTHYKHSWRSVAAYAATPDKTLATDMTQSSGTWLAFTDGPTGGFGGSVALMSTNAGDSLTFTTKGSSVFLSYLVGLTNSTTMGTFKVTVDGVDLETIDPNGVGFGNRNQYDTGGPYSYIPITCTNAIWCSRFADLGARQHTVVVTVVSATPALPVVIIWGAGSQQPIGETTGPYVWLLENTDRAISSTRDATYAAMRGKVAEVALELATDIGNVALIKPNRNFSVVTGLDADTIHPNDVGHTQVATAVLSALAANQGKTFPGSSSGSSSVSLSAPVTVSSSGAGVPAFKASTTGSGFGFMAEGNSFSFIARTASGTPSLFLNKSGGTISSPTAVTSGTSLGQIVSAPHDGGGYDSGALLYPFATEDHTATDHGTGWRFATVPNGSTTAATALTVGQDGSLSSAYRMQAFSGTSGAGAFEATTTNSGFGFLAEGNSFSFIARSATGIPSVFLNKAGGTIASPTAVTSGTTLGQIIAAPYDGAGYDSGALMFPYATENHTASAHGTGWRFSVVPNGSTTAGIALTVGQDSSLTAAYQVNATSGVSGEGAFEANTSGSGFGFLSSGTQFSFVGRVADGTPTIWANRAGTSLSSPVAVGSGVNTLGIVSAPYDGSTYPVGAGIYAYTAEAQATNAHGQGLRIYTVPNGSTTQTLAMTVGQDQSLLVAGALGATAITSTTTGTGLTLNGDGPFGVLLVRDNATDGNAKEIGFQRQKSGGAVANGTVIGRLSAFPHNGTTYPGRRAALRFEATETHDGSNQGTKAVISATANGAISPTDSLTVTGGGISVTGVAEVFPTTSTLAYSGTNVTQTASSRAYYLSTLTLTNNCLLTVTSTDGASGGITIVPDSSTSYTVYLDSGIKLLGGGSSFVVTNSASETVNLEWKQTKRGGSDLILANKAVYP